MNVYDFSAKSIKGKLIPLSQFKGKVLLIVNTATHCGYTKQYNAMQTIYQQYQSLGLEVLDFPSHTFLQTPEDNAGIQAFCERQFKTTFTTFEKIEVNGNLAHPLYQYLRKQNQQKTDVKIEWNFTKFLVNRRGEVVSRYNAKTTPEMLVKEIETLLNDR
jgi:glutathione peroxidase